MDFQTKIGHCWRHHATDTATVAEQLKGSHLWVTSPEQIPALANLLMHVYGEHLGQWQAGTELLLGLKQSPQFTEKGEVKAAIDRAVATLQLCEVPQTTLHSFSISDQIRIWAVAAAALVGQKRTAEASKFFATSLSLAEHRLEPKDPAYRSLAVTGNNLACELEERLIRNHDETTLMVQAARVARKYWEISGGAPEVQMADYRLAMSLLKAGLPDEALTSANASVALGLREQTSATNMFYSYEGQALVLLALHKVQEFSEALALARLEFAKISDSEKKWHEESLTKLTQMLHLG